MLRLSFALSRNLNSGLPSKNPTLRPLHHTAKPFFGMIESMCILGTVQCVLETSALSVPLGFLPLVWGLITSSFFTTKLLSPSRVALHKF